MLEQIALILLVPTLVDVCQVTPAMVKVTVKVGSRDFVKHSFCS